MRLCLDVSSELTFSHRKDSSKKTKINVGNDIFFVARQGDKNRIVNQENLAPCEEDLMIFWKKQSHHKKLKFPFKNTYYLTIIWQKL
jgi:hypothetical protein